MSLRISTRKYIVYKILVKRNSIGEAPVSKMSKFASKLRELGVECRWVDSNMPESVSNRPESLVE